MTRGTFYLICEGLVIESIEFNGDMYPSGHGRKAIKMLEDVETANDFRLGIEKFNKEEHHNYQDIESLTFPRKTKDYIKSDKILMNSETYFEKFFSDWTFFKNISEKTITIHPREGKKLITLKPMEQVAISFGHYEDHYKSLAECEAMIKKEDEERKVRIAKEANTIKKVSLYYKQGTSDKEYHLQLKKSGESYVVDFQYGRRGGNLQEGTKTQIPVPLHTAESIFYAIKHEKEHKGYH
jgi:hypothetical protein